MTSNVILVESMDRQTNGWTIPSYRLIEMRATSKNKAGYTSLNLYKSVCTSVRPLVRNAFVKIAQNGIMQDEDASYVVYTALLVACTLRRVKAHKID